MFTSLLCGSALLALNAVAVPTAGPAVSTQEERRQDERRRNDRRQDERRGNELDRREPPPPPPVQEERRVGQEVGRAPMEYRVKNILGTKVSIQGDITIGTVDDIVFSDEGYVEYLIVNNDGQLRTVPWSAAKFNFEKKTATINITQTQFQTIPTYTAERYPTFFAPQYRQETYRFYGITPRGLRRLDR